ncbi:MAG TPA: winged helix-turn-helix domain-containing protein [Candidatus Tumulicola sp.]|jgi:DNA-binding winged helix-turn-helix (wHTH) protein
MIRSRSTAKLAKAEDISAESNHWEFVFEPYRLDPTREMLTCGGKTVPLPSRLFALLYALVAADGKIVSRERLSLLLWPDGNVADGNLSQHIYMLRHALGKSGSAGQFILTVHGKGFRFAAPLTLATATRPLFKRLAASAAGPENLGERSVSVLG